MLPGDGAHVCFQKYGDVVWARDYEDSTYPNAKGGQGAGIRLYTDWGGVRSPVRWIRNDA